MSERNHEYCLRAASSKSGWLNLSRHDVIWAVGEIDRLRSELAKASAPSPTKRKFVSIGGPDLCAVDDSGDAWFLDDSGDWKRLKPLPEDQEITL